MAMDDTYCQAQPQLHNCDQLQLKKCSGFYGTPGKLKYNQLRLSMCPTLLRQVTWNEIFKDFPPKDSSYWNESQTGSDNFHCPFGSKSHRKAEKKMFLSFKNGPCPHLFGKHIKFTNGYFEEKLEPNGQSTARLALTFAQI